jgi:hypothetical protein
MHMEHRQIKHILEKYYQGESTLEEEKLLKRYRNSEPLDNADKSLQNYYKSEAETTINKGLAFNIILRVHEKSRLRRNIYFSAAAVLFLSFLVTLNTINTKNLDRNVVTDPTIALNETKETLQLVSHYLNKGTHQLESMNYIDKNLGYLKYLDKLKDIESTENTLTQ